MTEFKRKKGESFESFLRRFKRGLKNSKRIITAKSKNVFVPKKSKRKQKDRALNGARLRSRNEYLRKIGKLEETSKRR